MIFWPKVVQPYFHIKTCCIVNNNKYIPDKAVPVEYKGEVGMWDYPWIPQLINERRVFQKIYDTLVVRSVNKTKTKYAPAHPLTLFALEGKGRRLAGGGGVFC